ncbi:hypothetical protein SAMN05216278_0126 [Halopelagius longus]|uniref:Uncharacterized protein n=1 Tax=Halopelagius longus TaxID=1236180 RepID=A0A1H0XRK5_9EURY|nr:hypothetical protein SAMN05216278_0126 [Halopelagius longus]
MTDRHDPDAGRRQHASADVAPELYDIDTGGER